MLNQSTSTVLRTAASSPPAMVGFGLGIAALMMTILGFVWMGWGCSADPKFTVARWIILYLAFVALLGTAIQNLRKGKARMKTLSAERNEFWARTGKRFITITILEGVGCGIVVLLVAVFHRMDLLAAGISLIVGLHFLPLARLFRFPMYYASGIAIILIGLLAWSRFRSDAITLWVGVATGLWVGVATGTVLWLTAIYALHRSRKFLRNVATD